MNAVDELREWSLDKWESAISEWESAGAEVMIDRVKGVWVVTVSMNGAERTGTGAGLRDALVDLAVRHHYATEGTT